MEILFNYHTHTKYCDGKNTVLEVASEARRLGFTALGFSSHCYTPFSSLWSMSKEGMIEYYNACRNVQRLYKDEMDILVGLELEGQDENEYDEYDYVINSLHFLEKNGIYYPVDESPEDFAKLIEAFDGDPMKVCEKYYTELALTSNRRKPQIVGHFDLVTKFNKNNRFFDENSAKYREIAIDALRETAKCGGVFEINSGAYSRGWRDIFYPNMFILKELKNLGADIIISSDAHDIKNLNFAFRDMVEYVKEAGFKKVIKMTNRGLESVSL